MLNHTCIHINNEKYQKSSVAEIGIFQEKWASSLVADALDPRIASSSVAMVLAK